MAGNKLVQCMTSGRTDIARRRRQEPGEYPYQKNNQKYGRRPGYSQSQLARQIAQSKGLDFVTVVFRQNSVKGARRLKSPARRGDQSIQ